MYKCYERYASCETANDCHQMTFLTTRSAARILIINLRHRQALLLTRPAVLLGEGRPDTRERRKSSLPFIQLKKNIMSACKLAELSRPSEIKWYLVQEEDAKVFIFKNNNRISEKFLTSPPLA